MAKVFALQHSWLTSYSARTLEPRGPSRVTASSVPAAAEHMARLLSALGGEPVTLPAWLSDLSDALTWVERDALEEGRFGLEWAYSTVLLRVELELAKQEPLDVIRLEALDLRFESIQWALKQRARVGARWIAEQIESIRLSLASSHETLRAIEFRRAFGPERGAEYAANPDDERARAPAR